MLQCNVTVRESSVAQTISERIERLIINIQIIAAELLEPFAFRQRTAGILMVIEQRNLPHIFRESHRQFATRIYIAEQYIANGKGSFTTTKPYIQDGGHIFLFPVQHQRTAGEQYQYYRFTGFQ